MEGGTEDGDVGDAEGSEELMWHLNADGEAKAVAGLQAAGRILDVLLRSPILPRFNPHNARVRPAPPSLPRPPSAIAATAR